MKLVVVDNTTPYVLLNRYIDGVGAFLRDLECDYPFFSQWLEKVFREINLSKRSILLLIDESNDEICAVAILKHDWQENKICTLRVDCRHYRQGLGTRLVRESQRLLGDYRPLLTVPERHIKVFRKFLAQFGFQVKSRVKSLYHNGEYEYFFNVPYEHRNVLLSVKPCYSDAIFRKRKTVEFRRKCFSESVQRVYVYATLPKGKVVGCFTVLQIDHGLPVDIWERYGQNGGISRAEYDKYFEDCQKAYAILIETPQSYHKPLPLCAVMQTCMRPPQNYCYIDNVQDLKLLDSALFNE